MKRMMERLIVVAALFPTVALAQAPPSPPDPTPTAPVAAPSPANIIPPVRTIYVPCTGSQLVAHPPVYGGETYLAYTIAIDGTVKHVKVLQPSGDDDRDRFIAACIFNWRFKPALQDGVPVEFVKQLKVQWGVGH